MWYVSIKNPEAGIDVSGAFSTEIGARIWYARQVAMDPISKTTLYDPDKNILAENKVIRPKMDECKGDSSHGVEWVENILLSPLRI